MITFFCIIIIALCFIIAYLLTEKDKFYFDGERLKNFPVRIKGKEYWISRSCAVVGLVTKETENGLMFLANKRGSGCPDYVGYWNVPCGYVDYDESLEEAVSREVFEETGLNTKPEDWEFLGINSDPKKSNNQTISVRWHTKYDEKMGGFDTSHSEKDEVDEVKWIDINDIDDYNWAFNQYELLNTIREIVSKNH